MSQSKLHPEYLRQKALQDAYLARKNKKSDFYNGIYDRWENPVLTRESIPLSWRFDLNPATNPHFMERLGVNAVFNSGAIKLNGKYYLVARIEGNDRKSFFGVAESDSPVEGFHFWEKPILLPDTCPEETNVYDMRLTQHEDGWIYGVFCSESKDHSVNDLSAAVDAAGIVRTKDLKTWERLPNLVTKRSPQQRNVDLLPQELSGAGTADNRTPAVIPEYEDGTEAAAFVFDHAVVTSGKPQLPGLPMFRAGEGVETLSVFLKDAGGLTAELRYTVYEAEDLITRTVVYTNEGSAPLTLHKAATLNLDFAPDALELITLNGTWAAERTPERAALRCGIQISTARACFIPAA